jgi:hypothetical protein
LKKQQKLLTNISTMKYSESSQYMLFTIYFIGEKQENYLASLPKLYLQYKGNKFYYEYIKEFIYNIIYSIFEKDTIGEIVYNRISVIEYYDLLTDVPMFREISNKELSNAKRNGRKNYICTSKSNKKK